jgi:molybdate transport system substrate-binding protein
MTMKKALVLLLVLTFVLGMAACGKTNAPNPSPSPSEPAASPSPDEESDLFTETSDLYISAAASLTQPMNELAALYNEKVGPNVNIVTNFGGSGTLQTQIQNGSPADIFFSAATKYVDALTESGFVDAATRSDLLKNEIVLILPAGSDVSIASFEDAATDAVATIALGDTASVPAGQYAQEVFTALGTWDAVQAKAVYASDVRQVLSWVASGNADCGVVYKTDAALESGVKIAASAPEGMHKPILYPVAALTTAENRAAADSFLTFLQTDQALAVFERYGFTINK